MQKEIPTSDCPSNMSLCKYEPGSLDKLDLFAPCKLCKVPFFSPWILAHAHWAGMVQMLSTLAF
jgi:hypothetical protein